MIEFGESERKSGLGLIGQPSPSSVTNAPSPYIPGAFDVIIMWMGNAADGFTTYPPGAVSPTQFAGSAAGYTYFDPVRASGECAGVAATASETFPHSPQVTFDLEVGGNLPLGSMGAKPLNQPVVGMAADRATGGYWLVARDGGVFSFNAPFYGSTGNLVLNKPVVGMEAAPDGSGYRFVASDGGVFSYNLPYSGSMGGQPLNQPIVAMASSGSAGYWLLARDGGLFAFGGAPFDGAG